MIIVPYLLCRHFGMMIYYITETGIETEGNPKLALYENDMPMEEGRKLFLGFFHGKWRGNLDEFSLCEMQP